VLLLAACVPLQGALPTLSSVPMEQTAIVLTQAAPPPGFQGAVAYPVLDAKLKKLPAWRGSLLLTFDGVDATLKQPTAARITVDIFSDELRSARRVLFSASGPAFGVTQEREIEAVRLANDYYWALKVPAACAIVTDDSARKRVADLTAGAFVGGVKRAVPTGARDQINGQAAWEYAFAPDDLDLTLIHTDNVGKFSIAAGSLWVAPALDAVVRYTLTINVTDVRLLEGDLPVIGQLRIVYDLKEVGAAYNISVPFGC